MHFTTLVSNLRKEDLLLAATILIGAVLALREILIAKPFLKKGAIRILGPKPNMDSFLEVIRWSIGCWSQHYEGKDVARFIKSITFRFEEPNHASSFFPFSDVVEFNVDARATTLAELISTKVVDHFSPELSKDERKATIVRACQACPKDYYARR